MGVEHPLGRELDLVWRARGLGGADGEALGRLAELVERGARAWPGLEPDLAALERYVAERTAGARDLDPARAADWVLASECARGDARAVAALERTLMPRVAAAVRKLRLSPGELDVALQRVRTDLFVSAPDRPAGITRYVGRGELVAWLRVSAVRAAMKLARGRGKEVFLDDDHRDARGEKADAGAERDAAGDLHAVVGVERERDGSITAPVKTPSPPRVASQPPPMRSPGLAGSTSMVVSFVRSLRTNVSDGGTPSPCTMKRWPREPSTTRSQGEAQATRVWTA